MNLISEEHGRGRLDKIREEFRSAVRSYETRAKDCLACDTPGACCLDAHFVNVRISRLEATAIRREIEKLPIDLRGRVFDRVQGAIDQYGLTDHANEKFACPLYEKGIGCLVHATAKPLPCVQHACYERREDLPPDQLLDLAERKVEYLNTRVYGKASVVTPLPVAVQQT